HGLIGQCAQDGKPIDLLEPQGLPFTAASGYGGLVLHALLVLPIQRMERVLGVLSLASPTRFDAEHRRLLEEVLPVLGLNLEILAGNLETQQLLEQSRIQAQILAEAERKSRAILDAISVGMLLIDPRRGVVTDANPVALQLTGCTREDLLGQPCRTAGCTHPLRQCPALDRGERLEESEEVVVHTEGRETPVLKHVVPILLGGQPFLLESFADISAQKALESQLRESGERLQVASNALAHSPVSVMITDPQGIIEYVNPKFEELSGYTSEDVLGMTPRFLHSGLHTQAFYKDLWTTLLGDREWHGEICNRRKNGELYWVSASISSIHDDEGRIAHFVSVREDITARKRLDEELRERLDELERFSRMTVDRELRMVELKQEINALAAAAGQPARYTIVE
ncbi:MAG TPA: PAS domain S-box protein, partial [Holophaga sp.]|nr:PAS domain S-box protein [Holophaga sp.]